MHLKHIPMDGPQNFRDLGGFLTASGQAVAWNRLYRADGLADLSARDEALLQRLGVGEADITADYQVSHTYNENGLNRRIAARPELRGRLETAGEDTPLHSHPKNIRAVLESLNTGNIAGWLEAAGVPAGLQADFCSRMLEPIR